MILLPAGILLLAIGLWRWPWWRPEARLPVPPIEEEIRTIGIPTGIRRTRAAISQVSGVAFIIAGLVSFF